MKTLEISNTEELQDAMHVPRAVKAILKAFLYKFKPPVELAFAFVIVFTISVILLPYIPVSAATNPEPVTSIASSAAPPVPVELNAYQVLDASFSTAIQRDLERRFYAELIGGRQQKRIVEAIYAFAPDLNKDLVVAQLLQESKGDPYAHNENRDSKGRVTSVDRGLFQLNSRSYPKLNEDDFFNIEINVQYGTAHLRGELEHWDGNVRKALWTYNAGKGGISDGVPKRTLAYANDIIEAAKSISQRRLAYISQNLGRYSTAYLAGASPEKGMME